MPLTLLLHGRHADFPVLYQPFGSWIVPWRFGPTEEAYQSLRHGVGLVDDSTQALIEIRGADRVRFLQAIVTNDVKRLTPHTGCRAALLDPHAKCLAELIVLADPDALWLLCDLERAGVVAETLERYHFSEDIAILNHEREQAVLALQGPAIDALAEPLFDMTVSSLAPEDHRLLNVGEIPIRLIRHSLAGDLGLLVLVPASEVESLWNVLQHRGGPVGLRLAGWEALNIARIESGIPWFGFDMGPDNLLPETGLEDVLVSEQKGCYVGQEIVARMQTYGSPNKKLMGLRIEGDTVPRTGDAILYGDERAGSVTSACFSPSLRGAIAMGYVKRGVYEAGTVVQIAHEATRLKARITTLQSILQD